MNQPTAFRRPFRNRLGALLTGACLSAAALVSVPTAQAAPQGVLDLTCTPPSSSVTTYTPALTNTPQTVSSTVSYQFGPCLSSSGVTSGTAVLNNAPRQRSCLDLLGSASRTLTVTWNTGQTSTMSLNVSATVVGAVLQTVLTGTVTSGLFQGDAVLINQTAPAATILTCTAGLGTVPSLYSTVALEVTSL
ncbi:hypothetical protein C6N75_15820 [Streptomyces solincola]|uniref:Ig-like domain-containing protein n=1 Tax=Streptomyces solincola TaxID=2100817 RepID=A0A2S9PV00_9ACTN|nr:hypothetical protein [Streptomyces solincola]PRH78256.1 hypothetical protein C6N75_15820 [Streptomyces solincola]